MKIDRVHQLICMQCVYLSSRIGALLDYVVCALVASGLFTCLVGGVVEERYASRSLSFQDVSWLRAVCRLVELN